MMRYLGGKSRTARQIAGYLNHLRQPGQSYWEPFVGAGWVLARIANIGPNYASDANGALIAMWQALQNGWEPPDTVTEEQYRQAQDGEMSPEMTAFIGFGCSFGGKWFAGYARGETGRNYAQNAKESATKKRQSIRTVIFFQANFLTTDPPAPGCLIYCDPPYNDTTAYGAVPPFDHAKFWQRAEWLEQRGHTVVVSEYEAPSGFSCVQTMPTRTDLNTTNGKDTRIERLFRLGDVKPLQPTLWEAAT